MGYTSIDTEKRTVLTAQARGIGKYMIVDVWSCLSDGSYSDDHIQIESEEEWMELRKQIDEIYSKRLKRK